jgi:hypothetical protein
MKVHLVRLAAREHGMRLVVPNNIIIYIAGTITKFSPASASPIPSSTPAPGPAPVPTIPLESAPSVSFHSANTLSAEALSIPTTIFSPPAIDSVPSARLSPDIALVPATPALDYDADSIPDEPDAEENAAKPASKLEQWWVEHRKGVVYGVKTVLDVASKVLEDIPAGGSTAAMVLDFASKGLERVQVICSRVVTTVG